MFEALQVSMGCRNRHLLDSRSISAPSINLRYIRAISGSTEEIQYQAQYGDGYEAFGSPGLNKVVENWDITTVPMDACEAQRLRKSLSACYRSPFIWLSAPSGSQFKYYYVTPAQIQWVNGAFPQLKFKLQNWRNL